MTLRAAVGDPKTISMTFPAVATGDVEVTVTSSLTGVATGPFVADQENAEEPVYTYDLTAGDVASVDLLKVVFSGTVNGVDRFYTEHVQVAGGRYFEIDEVRSLSGMATYTDKAIETARLAVEDQIDVNCDTSFVGRYVLDQVNGSGEGFVRLSEPYVLRVLAVTEDDVDITDEVEVDGRFVWRNTRGTPWLTGHRNIAIHYEAGIQEFPPGDLAHAGREATRHVLLRASHTGTPSAVTSITTDMGAMRIAVAGLRQPFGFPEVDAVVLRWAKAVGTVL